MLKAIVFDFDGVIVDSEPIHHQAFLRVSKTFGVTYSYDEYVERYIGYDDRDAFRAMLGLPLGATPTPAEEKRVAQLIDDKADAFEAVVDEGIEMIPGVEALIRAAGAAMPIAIASGASRRDINLILGKLKLAPLFKLVVSADDVRRSKPDPETYAMAVELLAGKFPALGLHASACLAIEDTAAGIESARGAGLRTLALLTSTPPAKLGRATRVMEAKGAPTLEQVRAWFG
ncbi:MAG: HAD family phosphatase [Planctomycetota bacterium]|nr:HAD family phosphatase [Planctomycetota bacterium]